jgi:hypothetical protein
MKILMTNHGINSMKWYHGSESKHLKLDCFVFSLCVIQRELHKFCMVSSQLLVSANQTELLSSS